ncbi:hypothetical protein HDU76_005877, partial [Blyttiomyces sp. JEL0837]
SNQPKQPNTWLRGATAVISALIVAGIIGISAYYAPLMPDNLATAVTRENLVKHLAALESVAASDRKFGNSRSVMNGYNASVEYVVNQLKSHTDYDITLQPFTFPFFENIEPPKLSYTSSSIDLVPFKDFNTLTNSGSGNIKDAKIKVIQNGCRPRDFEKLKKNTVVLLSREVVPGSPGSKKCNYRSKVTNAINAGAVAALIYTTLPMGGPVLGRVGSDADDFPVLGISHPVALDLLQKLASRDEQDEEITISLKTKVHFRNVTSLNVIADTPFGNSSNVVVVGAHLDSVEAGSGINDDGSGTSVQLECALALYKTGMSKKVVNKVRFAWWSAEELGLLGSTAYVDDLAKNDPEELKSIALNLDSDMLASPNGARYIYNGREAEDPTLQGPSGKIQHIFESYFDSVGLPYALTPFDGRSDYGPFLKYGIPAGGLFTGAEEIKTEEEAKIFGGVPGIPLDPCYHRACDTLENIQSGLGMSLFLETSAATAYFIQKVAFEPNLRGFLWNQDASN